jgi:hypothetical protein
MQNIRYRGKSDIRRITDAQWLSVGITAPTIEWTKANGYEVIIDDLAAAYCLAQGEFEAGDPNQKFGNILRSPHVEISPGFGQVWDAAKATAGSSLIHAHVIGDSMACSGSGVTPNTIDNRRNLNITGLLETQIKTKYGNGGTGYLSHEFTTATGTWTARMGFAGTEITASAAASLQWTNIFGTTVRIYFKNQQSPVGSFRWRIDGGAWLPVTPPVDTVPPLGLTQFEPGYAQVEGLADTAHTIDIEWVSGTVAINGILGFRAAGIVFSRIGQSGRALCDYDLAIRGRIVCGTTNTSTNVTSAAHGAFNSSMINMYLQGAGIAADAKITAVAADGSSCTIDKAATATATVTLKLCYKPTLGSLIPRLVVDPTFSVGLYRAHLLIFMIGINDYDEGTTTLDYKASMGRWMKTYMSGTATNYSPDVVVITEHGADWFDLEYKYAATACANREMALGVGGAHYDVWGMGHRSHQYWQEEPHNYFTDSAHLNNAGYAYVATQVGELLCR